MRAARRPTRSLFGKSFDEFHHPFDEEACRVFGVEARFGNGFKYKALLRRFKRCLPLGRLSSKTGQNRTAIKFKDGMKREQNPWQPIPNSMLVKSNCFDVAEYIRLYFLCGIVSDPFRMSSLEAFVLDIVEQQLM